MLMYRKLLTLFLFISAHAFSQSPDTTNITVINSKDLSMSVGLVSKWQFQNAAPATFETQKTPSPTAKWYPIKLDLSLIHI